MALEETERRAYEAFYIKRIQKELNRWGKSVAIQIESGTTYALFQIQSNYLSTSRLETILKDLYQTVGDRFSQRTANVLKRIGINAQGLSSTTWTQAVEEHFERHAKQKILTIRDTTQDQVRKLVNETVEEGIKEGLGTAKIGDNIVKKLRGKEWTTTAKFRAETIARTEVHQAVNIAKMKTTEPYANELEKHWQSFTGRRPSHADRDEQGWIPYDRPFIGRSGSQNPMQMPGDPTGDPADTINCRCRVQYRRKV